MVQSQRVGDLVAVDLLLAADRTIDSIALDGWRIDVGYPQDRDEAEQRLRNPGAETTESEVSTPSEL